MARKMTDRLRKQQRDWRRREQEQKPEQYLARKRRFYSKHKDRLNAERRQAWAAKREKNYAQRAERRKPLQEYVAAYLQEHPCSVCGASDLRCLQFSHRKQSEKKHEVARILSCPLSMKTLETEIAKCDVVCANCVIRKRASVYRWGKSPRGNRTKQARENAEYLARHFDTNPCIDCGEQDSTVLQFDHRNPDEKSGNVGNMAKTAKFDELVAEVEKCDVRCANCHHKRTSEQKGWWRQQYVAGWNLSKGGG